MNDKKLSEMTDDELLQEAKKMKSAAIVNAVLIGFMVGVIVYSVVENTWGFLTLIPIMIIYKMINKPADDKQELDELLKRRNLK